MLFATRHGPPPYPLSSNETQNWHSDLIRLGTIVLGPGRGHALHFGLRDGAHALQRREEPLPGPARRPHPGRPSDHTPQHRARERGERGQGGDQAERDRLLEDRGLEEPDGEEGAGHVPRRGPDHGATREEDRKTVV